MKLSRDKFLVCLTGGIASGKTSVSKLFEENGIKVIDADVLSREAVLPGSHGLSKLVAYFGSKILQGDGSLNRPLLREIVFKSNNDLKMINGIVHPIVKKLMVKQIEASKPRLIVVVIPLYNGQDEYDFFDRICVVDVERDDQVRRLTCRDGIGQQLAESMINAQTSRKRRLELASDVIVNKGTLKDLVDNALKLTSYYKSC